MHCLLQNQILHIWGNLSDDGIYCWHLYNSRIERAFRPICELNDTILYLKWGLHLADQLVWNIMKSEGRYKQKKLFIQSCSVEI